MSSASASGSGSGGASRGTPAAAAATAHSPPARDPGAEFLEQRLRRAAAIPPAERSPEVAGLLEGAQLEREAWELIPVDSSGTPQPAHAGLQQVLLALEMHARAHYLCEGCTPGSSEGGAHLGACVRYLHGHGAGSTAPAQPTMPKPSDKYGALAFVLVSQATMAEQVDAAKLPAELPMASYLYSKLQCCLWRQEILSRPAFRQQVDSELAELTANAQRQHHGRQHGQQQQQQPPLTARQLQFLACTLVFVNAYDTAQSGAGGGEQPTRERCLTPAQLEAADRAKVSSAEMMHALEPDRPASCLCLAMALKGCAAGSVQRVISLCQRAIRLSQQQGSDLWLARSSLRFADTVISAGDALAVDCGMVQAALAALQQVVPAVRRCRRVLPESWLHPFQEPVGIVQKHQYMLEAMLQLLEGAHGSSESDVAAARSAVHEAEAALQQSIRTVQQANVFVCDGCHQTALNLRRCSRCRHAVYCRQACAVAACCSACCCCHYRA